MAYTTLERGQSKEYDIRACYGEAGFGIYFYVAPNKKLREYYTRNGESLITLIFNGDKLFDVGAHLVEFLKYAKREVEIIAASMPGYIKPRITKSNYQRFGRIIQDFVKEKAPDCGGWIVNHEGPNMPKGRQVVLKEEFYWTLNKNLVQ